MSIAYRSSSTATAAAATSVTVAAPSGVAQYDLLITVLVMGTATTTVTPPTGWVAVNGLLSPMLAVWYKFAGASEPANYTWSVARSETLTVTVLDYTGTDGTAPVIATTAQINTSSVAAVAPGLTTPNANTMVLALVGTTSNVTFTAPSGFTSRGTLSASGASVWTGEQAYATSGTATGTVTTPLSGSALSATMLLCLQTPQVAYNPPVWVSSATTLTTSATSLNVNYPPVMGANNLLLAQVLLNSNTTTVTPPSGWTSVRTDTTSGLGAITQAIYQYLVTGSEGASMSWSWSGSAIAVTVNVFCYAGNDAATPVTANAGTVATSTTIVAPSVTTTSTNNLIVVIASSTPSDNAYPTTYSASWSPLGYPAAWDGDTTFTSIQATRQQTTIGASANANIILFTSSAYIAATIAIQPTQLKLVALSDTASGAEAVSVTMTGTVADSATGSDVAALQTILTLPPPQPQVPSSLFPFSPVPSGVYESVTVGGGTDLTRLDDIAARGFNYVLCYDVNNCHLSALEAYLTRCAADGLKLIFNFGHACFWTTGQSPITTFATMAADLGATTTSNYISLMISAISGYSAVAGWYIADEPSATYASNVLANAQQIASLSTLPRLLVVGGIPAPSAGYPALFQTWTGCCDVLGVNYYAYEYSASGYDPTQTGSVAMTLASVCQAAGIQATVVCQAFPWTAYSGTGVYPPASVMRLQRDLVLLGVGAAITMPYLLWYSYFDSVNASQTARLRDAALAVWGNDTQ